jgi:PhnB protein
MRISPHLIFDGQCRAAFDRYHRVLGGELSMLTFGESPMAPEVEPHWHDRIVHATLRVGDLELAGADVLPQDYATPQGFSVLLAVEDLAEAEKIFAELATDGEVKLAFQATFWSSGFGVLTDRFGIPWEVSYE